jgi:SAM-dependent methyltransferase
VEFARIRPDERVLDVGCGAGAVLGPASRVAGSAVGVELSPAMAERARQVAPAAEVLVGDASTLSFDDSSFDVVLSAFVVFFMPDPTAALREWARVTKPAGRMVLSTWGSADPRWSWERDLRRSFIPEMDQARLPELGEGLARMERFSEGSKVRDELRLASLEVAEQVEHQIEFVFPDEQAWWDWNWSHATRTFFEAMPQDAQERFRAQARKEMQALRDERGYARTYTALFTRAISA